MRLRNDTKQQAKQQAKQQVPAKVFQIAAGVVRTLKSGMKAK